MRHCDRAGSQRGEDCDIDRVEPARLRSSAGDDTVDEISSLDRDQEPNYEGRVRRSAKQVDAGQHVVHQAEYRRIPAERIKQNDSERDREKADFAYPQQAACESSAKDQHNRQNAAIYLAHVLRERDAARPHGCVPADARRAPEVDIWICGTEQVGKRQHQQQDRMERAAPRARQAYHRPIAVGGEQRREHQRNDRDDGSRYGAGRKRNRGASDADESSLAIEPPGEDIKGEHVKSEQRNLIASNDQERHDHAGRKAGTP